jgi:hypothetical protein
MRSSRLFVRVVLFAACLLAAAPALAAGLFGGPPEPGKMPTRFVRFDALDVGEFVPLGDWPAMSAHVASVTCVLNRVRFGVTAADLYTAIDFWDGCVVLPVHIGYTIVSNPKATWRLWGAVPDVHVDAIGSFWENRDTDSWPPSLKYSPTIELALCCDVDYYGLGTSLRVGGYKSAAIGYEVGDSGLFAELRLRVVTFGIGF